MTRVRSKWMALPGALAMVLSSVPPSLAESVRLKSADRTIPLGQQPAADVTGKTRAEAIAAACVSSGTIDFREAETLSAGESGTKLSVTIVRLDQAPKKTAATYPNREPRACMSATIEGAAELVVNPSRLWCSDDKPVVNGAIVYIAGSAGSTCLEIANARWLNYGSDYGFALNLVDREGDSEAFDVQQGFSGYWALSKLKSRTFRPIVNVSLLDFDKEGHDLEVGIGLGIVFKPSGLETDTGKGFSIGVGYGSNLMIRKEDDPGYWFVGLGFNVPTAGPEVEATK
jgi:hypothetical protein